VEGVIFCRVADIMTKALPESKFITFRDSMGMAE
jgi:hypothetical protein